jgi:type IV pilus assembly protein PilW
MTLVELLVAMVIGLVVTLVVTTLLVSGENHKRTTTSTNDAEQTGSYAFHALDRALRNAGSGIAQSAYQSATQTDKGVLGCRLFAAGFLPRAGAFPAPFATAFLNGVTNSLRVAPLLIAPNQSDGGSDVLVVMGGSGTAGGVSRPLNGIGSATSVSLDNTVGFNQSDVFLVSQGGVPDCLLEEVAQQPATGAQTLNVGGTTYYTGAGSVTDLQTLASSISTYVTPLGNATINNLQFELFGVGTDNTLYSYDLLRNQQLVQGTGGDTSQAIADGVVQLKALYGLQVTAAPGVLNGWVSPADPGYDITSVMTSETKMESIIAVHVALVVRGEYYDKNIVSPAALTIFSTVTRADGTALTQNIPLNVTPDQRHYRYRVFEFTIPLRNMLILAKG